MTVRHEANSILRFGKHRGEKVIEAFKSDPGWFVWLQTSKPDFDEMFSLDFLKTYHEWRVAHSSFFLDRVSMIAHAKKKSGELSREGAQKFIDIHMASLLKEPGLRFYEDLNPEPEKPYVFVGPPVPKSSDAEEWGTW